MRILSLKVNPNYCLSVEASWEVKRVVFWCISLHCDGVDM